MEADDEDKLLRSVALKNANSILLARRRVEQDLIQAKDALERKTAELAHSLSMVRATLESTTNAIVVSSDVGRITGFNENYLAMWGLAHEQVEAGDHWRVVESISKALKEPREFLAHVQAILASSEESLDLLELADGRIIERYSKAQVVGGRNVGRVWSFHDVTEAKRAEAERNALFERERYARAEAEHANAMKDEFLATLSHELRTPLSAILGWSQVLRRRRAMSEAELQQGLETIERNARAQTQLIDDLLDMSRITSGKLRLDIQPIQPVLFIEAAIETVRPAAEAKGICIEKRLDPAAGPISGDPSRLQQVIWNLLSNAIKFTAKEGQVRVGLERSDGHVEITISDTGIGIDPDFLPYVFERFRQADATTTRLFGGLGLGLSIVKRLVELHGGTVRAKSAGEGRGSTFEVRIPLTAVPDRTEPVVRLQSDT